MKYTAYRNRRRTDVFFAPADGSCQYTGTLADAVRFVEEEQLLDPSLWALFVAQFRIGTTDDRDLGWRCEYWGKMMRGACFTYSYTQNKTLYRVLEASVRDLLTAQDALGRFSTYSVEKEFSGWDVWGRKYIMLGMQYFLEICRDDALSDAIVDAMCAHADYMTEKIGKREEGKCPITETARHWGGLASSSILEPYVRLYNLTGKEKYLRFAEYIIGVGGTREFNVFEAALEGKLYPYEYPVTKAYEMISNFEGILEYYRVTGEEKYKQMAINFAWLVMTSDITVIGCAGTTHELFDHSAVRQFDPAFDGIMQETCVTVTWMKFCHQLLCLTGDPVYADQIERSAYNALLGAVNVNRNICKDQAFAFDSYSPLLNGVRGMLVGGWKDLLKNRFWWGCCVAIGAAGTALVPMSAVMRADDGIAVNLYLAGEYTQTAEDGTKVTVRMDTDYPKSGDVRLTVSVPSEKRFSLRLRIPSWSRENSLTVNGEAVSAQTGSYAVLDRAWNDGDTVCLSLDMRAEVIYALDVDPEASEAAAPHLALRRGPVMLARDAMLGEDVASAVSVAETNGYATLIPSETATFRTEQEYRVETTDGAKLTVVDYASAGQSWDPACPITVWMTTKTPWKQEKEL